MSQIKVNSIVPVGGLPSGATAGGIIQTVTTVKKDVTSSNVSSTGDFDFTGFSVAITPTLNSSKILILGTINVGWSSTMPFFMQLKVNGSLCADAIGDAAGSRNRSTIGAFQGHTGGIETLHFSFIHSPASTSTQTYNLAFRHDSSQTKTVKINANSGDSDSAQNGRWASSLIAMEMGV